LQKSQSGVGGKKERVDPTHFQAEIEA
jgi:hypothetical protein